MPLQDYTMGNVIGKGTYGEVSLVKHKKDRKQVRSGKNLFRDDSFCNFVNMLNLYKEL